MTKLLPCLVALTLPISAAFADVAVYNGSAGVKTTSADGTSMKVLRLIELVDLATGDLQTVTLSGGKHQKQFTVSPVVKTQITQVGSTRNKKVSTVIARADTTVDETAGVTSVNSLLLQGQNFDVKCKAKDDQEDEDDQDQDDQDSDERSFSKSSKGHKDGKDFKGGKKVKSNKKPVFVTLVVAPKVLQGPGFVSSAPSAPETTPADTTQTDGQTQDPGSTTSTSADTSATSLSQALYILRLDAAATQKSKDAGHTDVATALEDVKAALKACGYTDATPAPEPTPAP